MHACPPTRFLQARRRWPESPDTSLESEFAWRWDTSGIWVSVLDQHLVEFHCERRASLCLCVLHDDTRHGSLLHGAYLPLKPLVAALNLLPTKVSEGIRCERRGRVLVNDAPSRPYNSRRDYRVYVVYSEVERAMDDVSRVVSGVKLIPTNSCELCNEMRMRVQLTHLCWSRARTV
jgi:hypothetical protein